MFADLFINGMTESIFENRNGMDLVFVQEWLVSYTEGIIGSIFKTALITAAAGILFIVAGFLLNRKDKRIKKGNGLILFFRILIVILLVAATPVIISKNVNDIKQSIDVYKEINEKVNQQKVDFGNAIGDILNIDFLKNVE